MIRISLLTKPVDVDLSEIYPGFKVVLRRLKSGDMAAARDRAIEALRAAREGLEALQPYGLDGADAHGVHLNPLDSHQMARIGRLVGAVEVMVEALESWEGVCLEDGSPAPITREVLSILLQDDGLERRLIHEVEQASRILVTEGNG